MKTHHQQINSEKDLYELRDLHDERVYGNWRMGSLPIGDFIDHLEYYGQPIRPVRGYDRRMVVSHERVIAECDLVIHWNSAMVAAAKSRGETS